MHDSSYAMAILLLLVIYIAFIGLGLPDSLFGTAWPAIYNDMGLPFSFGSFVTLITSCGTVFSSIKSDSLITRWGTYRVTLASTLLTAIAILGMALSGNFLFLCLCALPLGLGAGAIDSALNNYVSLHYSSAKMNFLHCFYGLGVTLSPFILSNMLQGESGWRGGYLSVFFIQAAIAMIILISYPLWVTSHNADSTEEKFNTLPLKEVLRLKGIYPMLALFFASVGLEMSCGAWGTTYLVETASMTASEASHTVMFYFLGIAVGRFLSGVMSMRLHGWKIVRISMCILLLALLMLLFTKCTALITVAMMLIGIGNGPMFPNFSYMTPENFGRENSMSVMGVQIAVANISLMIMPALCGLIAQYLSMNIFPYFLSVCFLVMIAAYRLRPRR